MNKFLKLFTPSEDKIEKMSFKDQAQLPTAIYGNLIFVLGFTVTFLAEIFRGKILTGIGSGIADLLFITALILIKKNKVHIGLTFDTFGILTAILAIVFFLHSNDNIFEIYRSICFIVVMAIFNQLFSVNTKQLNTFFILSTCIWIAAIILLYKEYFAIDFVETLSALVISSIAFIGSNFAILLLTKQKDLINQKAVEEKKSTDASLSTLKSVLNQSTENLQIGNKLSQQVESLTSSFEDIKNLYDYLSSESSSLSEKTSAISNSSKQVKDHVQKMQNTINGQNDALSQTSSAMTQISANIQNINTIADERIESMNTIEETLNMQLAKILDLVHEVNVVQQSTDSISKFVNTVNAVASRTGLLAMNASIEAAHAGVAGKGFSVIAQEIRKLSDETNKNSHNIEDEVKHIIELVGNASDTAQNCIQYTKTSNENLKTTIDGIEEMLFGIGEITIGVEEVLNSLQQIVDGTKFTDTLVNQTVKEINEQDSTIATISNFTDVLQQKVTDMSGKISSVNLALHSVQSIAKQNSESVEKLTGTLTKN